MRKLEILHLGGDPCRKRCASEQTDRPDPTRPLAHRLPRRIHVRPDGRDQPQTRDHNPPFRSTHESHPQIDQFRSPFLHASCIGAQEGSRPRGPNPLRRVFFAAKQFHREFLARLYIFCANASSRIELASPKPPRHMARGRECTRITAGSIQSRPVRRHILHQLAHDRLEAPLDRFIRSRHFRHERRQRAPLLDLAAVIETEIA